jgi:hypothetical protein
MHSVTVRITHAFPRSGSHRPAGFTVRAAVFSIALSCLLFASTARAQLASVTVTPASVGSPATASGTVTFGAAVASATTVTLTSSNPSLVEVPASVIVASGNSSQTFGITVNPATTATTITISAAAGSDTVSTDLAVAACAMAQATAPTIPSGDTVWIGDTLPSGSYLTHAYGSAMDWTTDQAADGTSSLYKPYSASNTLNVSTINGLNQTFGIGQSFVAYVLPNPCVPPREIRFTLQTPLGATTIYWGNGMADDASATRIGNLPTPGVWSRLEVPLSQLFLEQRTVTAIDLSYKDWQVFFDHIGVSGTACVVTPTGPTIPAGDTVWIGDTLPAGASIGNAWGYGMVWTTDQAADGTKSLYKPYYSSNNTLNVSSVNDLNQTFGIGQSFVAYVLPSSCVPPREIRFTFQTPLGPTAIYWGGGMADDAGATRIGNLPTPGVWTRLEVPLSQLFLEQRTVTAIDLSYLDGQVFFDHIGVSGTACVVTPTGPTIPAGDTVWIGDTLPAGASIGNAWGYGMVWTTDQAADGTKSLYKPYYSSNNTLNVSSVNDLNQTFGIGQSFVAYILRSSCVPPREIRFTFQTPLVLPPSIGAAEWPTMPAPPASVTFPLPECGPAWKFRSASSFSNREPSTPSSSAISTGRSFSTTSG